MKFTNRRSDQLINSTPADSADKIIVRGIHLELSPALHTAARDKAARLFRHHARIVRVRVDLELDRAAKDDSRFIAKGHIEISGPDLIAKVSSNDAYNALDLLVDKLDRMLRERTRARADRRNNRPEGSEFRDKLAAMGEVVPSVSATT
jgi:putative sigma-54 modulation protein